MSGAWFTQEPTLWIRLALVLYTSTETSELHKLFLIITSLAVARSQLLHSAEKKIYCYCCISAFCSFSHNKEKQICVGSPTLDRTLSAHHPWQGLVFKSTSGWIIKSQFHPYVPEYGCLKADSPILKHDLGWRCDIAIVRPIVMLPSEQRPWRQGHCQVIKKDNNISSNQDMLAYVSNTKQPQIGSQWFTITKSTTTLTRTSKKLKKLCKLNPRIIHKAQLTTTTEIQRFRKALAGKALL